MMKQIKKHIGILVTLVLAAGMLLPCCAEEAPTDRHAKVLYISAYGYDWASVPYQIKGVSSVFTDDIETEYVFMNTKKFSYDFVKQDVYSDIEALYTVNGTYDLIIAEDDSALDFVLEYRDELFADTPVVFMGINTAEKANAAHQDPLITGMIECFPYHETIELAAKMYPNATKIVGISDATESGRGCSQRFFDEEAAFPQLEFSEINTSLLSQSELAQQLSSLDSSTILVFLAFVNDADGNNYSLSAATDFVNKNASIPMFKADMIGIGMGVLGGYVSSYEEMGKAAAEQAMQILGGTSPADIPVDTMGGYPLFDHNVMEQYHISSQMLPEGSVVLNRDASFFELYRTQLLILTFIILALFLLFTSLVAISRKKLNDQLKVAIEKVDSASKAKSQFLARMSHEIRTPMNAIIGETTIAQKEIENRNKVKECLDKVLLSSRHLLNLINDILDMSAIESNKIKLAHVRFDLKEVVDTITTLYYSQCSAKQIRFASKLENMKYEFLIGDQLRIQQIILNLLSNALKFTEPGGEITFRLREEETETGLNLFITVRDTGCGMTEEFMSRIFKPFEQESSLTAKEHGGSGLGLSISKNFAELMGGTVQLESKVGVGTAFTVTLPLQPAQEQAPLSGKAMQPMNAILIDDDPDALEYAGSILANFGIGYDMATSGEEAINIITKARNDKKMYDICMIDWKMRGISGLELTRRIRTACGDAPIVVIASGYDLNEIRDEVDAAGVDACISKPLFQSTVFNLLNDLTSGRLVNKTADAGQYDFTGKRILLVDDNELNREIACDLLEMVGFAVDTANDGKQGSNAFIASPEGTYDAILMDVQMPVMNGYDATRVIRSSAHPQAKSVLIFAMTANAFSEDIANSLEAGMNDHFSKPIDTEVMYQVLNRYLNQ